MANHHMTDKGPIPFTAEEEIEWAEKEVIADKKRKEEMEEYERVKYQRDRKGKYPPIVDYLDGIVKGDQAQVDKYIADCLAVKEKYPKGDN